MRNKFLIDLARDLAFHPLIFQTPQEKTERSSNTKDKTKEILKIKCCRFQFLRLFGLFSLHC